MEKTLLENNLSELNIKSLKEIIEKKLYQYYSVLILYCLYKNHEYFGQYSQYLIKDEEISQEILRYFLYTIISMTGGGIQKSDILSEEDLKNIGKNFETNELLLNSNKLQNQIKMFGSIDEIYENKDEYSDLYIFYISIITMNNQNDHRLFEKVTKTLKTILNHFIKEGLIQKNTGENINFKEILKSVFEKQFTRLMTSNPKLTIVKKNTGKNIKEL